MLNAPVSLLIAVGTFAGAGAAPATPTVPVTATAPIPAAFIKFLREYFIASLLMFFSVFVNQESSGIGGWRTRSGRTLSDGSQTRIRARAAYRRSWPPTK